MRCLNAALRSHGSTFATCLTSRSSCSKLFVGGLSYDTNEAVLKDAFEVHGEVIEVKVICDHTSGESKGYGFVRFTDPTGATKALEEMDGQLLDGRHIRVQHAHNETNNSIFAAFIQREHGKQLKREFSHEAFKGGVHPRKDFLAFDANDNPSVTFDYYTHPLDVER